MRIVRELVENGSKEELLSELKLIQLACHACNQYKTTNPKPNKPRNTRKITDNTTNNNNTINDEKINEFSNQPSNSPHNDKDFWQQSSNNNTLSDHDEIADYDPNSLGIDDELNQQLTNTQHNTRKSTASYNLKRKT